MACLPSFTYPASSEEQVGVYKHSGLTLNPCQSTWNSASALCCLPAEEPDSAWGKGLPGSHRTEAGAANWVQRVRAPGQSGQELLTLPVLPHRGSHAAVGIGGRLEGLTQDLQQLQENERQLDHLIHICTTQLRLLSEDTDNQRYPWTWWRPGGIRDATPGTGFRRGLWLRVQVLAQHLLAVSY